MTTGGIILIACILTIFAIFASTVAWGVHQTNAQLRERAQAKPVARTPTQPAQTPSATTERVLQAA